MRNYLIVDDNLPLAENLAEILEAHGGSAVAVGGAQAAVAEVRKHRFDALVTDMRMPVANGAQLVHELRKFDPDLPACVMTAYTADDDLTHARQEGLLSIFAKPVPIADLLRTLSIAKRGGMVAIIEDDLALSDNLTEALQGRGFGVVTAASVVETDRLAPVKPFAALVDVRVPGGSDGEAVRRFTARFPSVPLLAMTAHGAAGGFTPSAVFQKPFDTAALLAMVEKLYAESQR